MIEVVIFKTYNMYGESAQDITGEFLRYDCAVIKISDNLKIRQADIKVGDTEVSPYIAVT